MTIYVVELTIDTAEPLTEAALEAVAEIGGGAGGALGGRRLDTALTVEAADPVEAGARAIALVGAAAPGAVAAIGILTEEEADRRLAEPAFPALAGVSEVAAALGISKQRLAVLRARPDFPAPVTELAAGPIWRERDLSTFATGWRRRPGRPRAIAAE